MKLVVNREELRELNEATIGVANVVPDGTPMASISRVVVDLPGRPRCLLPVVVEPADEEEK